MRSAIAVLLIGAAGAVAAGGPVCPPGLDVAAEALRGNMQKEQDAIRTSTLDSPRGVEETVQFDLGAHSCHRGPGQAYRVFGSLRCLPVDVRGRVPVHYSYTLQYRKALTLEDLFTEPWQTGSSGMLEVTFAPEGGRWVPVERREVLIPTISPDRE